MFRGDSILLRNYYLPNPIATAKPFPQPPQGLSRPLPSCRRHERDGFDHLGPDVSVLAGFRVAREHITLEHLFDGRAKRFAELDTVALRRRHSVIGKDDEVIATPARHPRH